jgi:hypothetical protein
MSCTIKVEKKGKNLKVAISLPSEYKKKEFGAAI